MDNVDISGEPSPPVVSAAGHGNSNQ